MLEAACEDFENLLDLIDGDIKVVIPPRDAAMSRHKAHRLARASARMQMALAKFFFTRTEPIEFVGKIKPHWRLTGMNGSVFSKRPNPWHR